jgi:hypothetical protein
VLIREGAEGGVYRHAPVVELVPVQERTPLVGLRRFDGKMSALDVSIGNAWGTNWGMNRAVIAKSAISAAPIVLLIVALNAEWPRWTWFIFALGMILDLVNSVVMLRTVRDRITVAGGYLTWKREHAAQIVPMGTVELSRVTRVHDAGDHIRVDLEDGTFWEVGKGLKVPRRVRRWVARRVAQFVPPQSAHGAVARLVGSGEPSQE